MSSGVEQDDKDFRATISDQGELLATTFAYGTPASNVEHSLQSVHDDHLASKDETMQYHGFHQVAKTIRSILKDWRLYDVQVGHEYDEGEVLDAFILGYSAMSKLGEDRNNRDSLAYRVTRCITDEVKLHSQRKDFTQAKREEIVAGATKAYLKIMTDADLMAYGAAVRDLKRDPKPSMALFTAWITMSEVESNALLHEGGKAPFSNDTDDEKDGGAAPPKSTKKPKKSTASNLIRLMPMKKGGNSKGGDSKSPFQDAGSSEFGFINEMPSLDAYVEVKRSRGSGNFDHVKGITWSQDERESAIDLLRDLVKEDVYVTFDTHAEEHNKTWEGTIFDDGKNGAVTRGKRTGQAMYNQFKKDRRDFGGGINARLGKKTARRSAEAKKGVEAKAGGAGKRERVGAFDEVVDVDEEEAGEMKGEEESVVDEVQVSICNAYRTARANWLQETEEDNDVTGDLEELNGLVDAGETFEDE